MDTLTARYHDDGTVTVGDVEIGRHEPRALRKKYTWQDHVTDLVTAAGYTPISSWTRGMGRVDDDTGKVIEEPDDFFTMAVHRTAAKRAAPKPRPVRRTRESTQDMAVDVSVPVFLASGVLGGLT